MEQCVMWCVSWGGTAKSPSLTHRTFLSWLEEMEVFSGMRALLYLDTWFVWNETNHQTWRFPYEVLHRIFLKSPPPFFFYHLINIIMPLKWLMRNPCGARVWWLLLLITWVKKVNLLQFVFDTHNVLTTVLLFSSSSDTNCTRSYESELKWSVCSLFVKYIFIW